MRYIDEWMNKIASDQMLHQMETTHCKKKMHSGLSSLLEGFSFQSWTFLHFVCFSLTSKAELPYTSSVSLSLPKLNFPTLRLFLSHFQSWTSLHFVCFSLTSKAELLYTSCVSLTCKTELVYTSCVSFSLTCKAKLPYTSCVSPSLPKLNFSTLHVFLFNFQNGSSLHFVCFSHFQSWTFLHLTSFSFTSKAELSYISSVSLSLPKLNFPTLRVFHCPSFPKLNFPTFRLFLSLSLPTFLVLPGSFFLSLCFSDWHFRLQLCMYVITVQCCLSLLVNSCRYHRSSESHSRGCVYIPNTTHDAKVKL